MRLFLSLITLLVFSASVVADDSDIKTRLEYARVLSYTKKYDESIAEYQKVLKEDPNLTEAKIELAKVYYYQKNYPEALKSLSEVSGKDRTPDVELVMADIYMVEKDYPKAEEIYRRILDKVPGKKDFIQLRLAEMLSWQKRYDDSLTIYRELIGSHPDDIQLRRKYAMVLLWAGHEEEAAAQLKSTLKD